MEPQVKPEENTPVVPTAGEGTSHDVEVTVEYLPAAKPFHHSFAESTTLGTVRTDAMQYFGVSDHQDRDTHQFFLEFKGQRLTNPAQTLEQLLGPHRKEAHFNLVEQITAGGRLE